MFLAAGTEEFQGSQEGIDMVPTPAWAALPSTGPYLGTSPMIITNYSEHQKEAFQVLLEYISPENQLEMVQNGSSASVLEDPAILEQFAANNEQYKDKNRDAWFIGEPAIYEETQSEWDLHIDISGALKKVGRNR